MIQRQDRQKPMHRQTKTQRENNQTPDYDPLPLRLQDIMNNDGNDDKLDAVADLVNREA